MNGVTLVRVQKIVPNEDGIHIKFKETFVNIPNELYENALREKKATQDLASYAYFYTLGILKEHLKLVDYVQNVVGRIDGANIERINPTPITNEDNLK